MTTIKVSWDGHQGMWVVSGDKPGDSGTHFTGRYPSHDAAVSAARRFARHRSPSTIIVYGPDGKVEEECTVNIDEKDQPSTPPRTR